MTETEDFENFKKAIIENATKAEAREFALRRVIDTHIRKAMLNLNINNNFDFLWQFGIPRSQTNLLLKHIDGGHLSLSTICRAAEALNLDVSIKIKPKTKKRKAKKQNKNI